jgi:hypothetical protein
MDKDNLDIQGFLSNLATDALRSARAETFQQLISTLCLTAVGIFLTLIGLLGLTLKLGRLVKFSLLFLVRPIAIALVPNIVFAAKKTDAKIALGITDR